MAYEQWEEPPIHPANRAPRMSAAELKQLAQDIKEHGMHEPIVIWKDNREEANGSKGPFPTFLLDGINRLEALKLLGITDPFSAIPGALVQTTVRTVYAIKRVTSLGGRKSKSGWMPDVDPWKFHLSANAFRRHLKAEQKRKMIKSAIADRPNSSDRAIARTVGVHQTTVSRLRLKGGPNDAMHQKAPPLQRAKEAIAANPNASVKDVMKTAEVSENTVKRARRQVEAQEKTKKMIPAVVHRGQDNQATEELTAWLLEQNQVPTATVIVWLTGAKIKAVIAALRKHQEK